MFQLFSLLEWFACQWMQTVNTKFLWLQFSLLVAWCILFASASAVFKVCVKLLENKNGNWLKIKSCKEAYHILIKKITQLMAHEKVITLMRTFLLKPKLGKYHLHIYRIGKVMVEGLVYCMTRYKNKLYLGYCCLVDSCLLFGNKLSRVWTSVELGWVTAYISVTDHYLKKIKASKAFWSRNSGFTIYNSALSCKYDSKSLMVTELWGHQLGHCLNPGNTQL